MSFFTILGNFFVIFCQKITKIMATIIEYALCYSKQSLPLVPQGLKRGTSLAGNFRHFHWTSDNALASSRRSARQNLVWNRNITRGIG